MQMIDLSHIHPMLVHFPIVFFITATVIFLVTALRAGNLAARDCLPLTGAGALVIGLLMAYFAAFFGDVALDAAIAKGFALAPLERHEDMALATLTFFSLLAVVLLAAIWKKISLERNRAWYFFAATAVGIVLLLITAYYGGELVYGIGVNVDAVVPLK
jgi:uncharacterized membrane protein